jgi:hypothetical protein
MPIATKSGRIILKTGRIAENCACCVAPCEIDYRDAVSATVVISGGEDAFLQWTEVFDQVTYKTSLAAYGKALNGTFVFSNFVPVQGFTTALRSRIFLNDPPGCTAPPPSEFDSHTLSFTVNDAGFWALTARRIPALAYSDRSPAPGVNTSIQGNQQLVTPNFQYYAPGEMSCAQINNSPINPFTNAPNPLWRPGGNCTEGGANWVISSCLSGFPRIIPPATTTTGRPHVFCRPGLSGAITGSFISGSIHDASGWFFTPTTFAQLGTESLRYTIESVEIEF